MSNSSIFAHFCILSNIHSHFAEIQVKQQPHGTLDGMGTCWLTLQGESGVCVWGGGAWFRNWGLPWQGMGVISSAPTVIMLPAPSLSKKWLELPPGNKSRTHCQWRTTSGAKPVVWKVVGKSGDHQRTTDGEWWVENICNRALQRGWPEKNGQCRVMRATSKEQHSPVQGDHHHHHHHHHHR